MTVVITEPEQSQPAVEPSDQTGEHAFAAGAVVGEFRAHMDNCRAEHVRHEEREGTLEARLAAVEAAMAATAAMAVAASAEAEEAQIAAEEQDEEKDDEGVVEMEMPDVPVEETQEPERKRGFHLW